MSDITLGMELEKRLRSIELALSQLYEEKEQEDTENKKKDVDI